MRSPIQFHETTGAVFDTLAQIHLMRGSYERAGEYLRQASDAYGAYGTQTMRWYEWSLKVLGVKLAIRRGAYDEAIAMADELAQAPGVPPADAIQADLAACEALVAAGRIDDAEQRLETCEDAARSDDAHRPTGASSSASAASFTSRPARPPAAHHDFAQSANVFELLGERYQAALSQLALGRLAAAAGSRRSRRAQPRSRRPRSSRRSAPSAISTRPPTRARLLDADAGAAPQPVFAADAEEGIVRRLVDAAIFPELLARETATALIETHRGRCGRSSSSRRRRRSARRRAAPAAMPASRARWRAPPLRAVASTATAAARSNRSGKDHDGPRALRHRRVAAAERRGRSGGSACSPPSRARGSSCAALRERPAQAVEQANERPLEPLLPGFICASAAMNRLSRPDPAPAGAQPDRADHR